jgi:HK97 family phage major capsid protein
MELKEMEAAITQIGLDLKPYVEKEKAGTLTADEDSAYDTLLAKLNDLGPQYEKALGRQTEAAGAIAIAEGRVDPVVRTLSADDLAAHQFGAGRKSIGQQFIESDEFKSVLANGDTNMRGSKVKFEGTDFLHQKALVYSGTPSASMLLPQVLPTIYRGEELVSPVRQVLQSMRTNAEAVTVLRENVFTNAATEVAEAVSTSTGTKPESSLTFTEETFTVRNIAHWIPVTRQMLQDLPMMESYIDGRLRDGLERRISDALINGNGTPPNISGLLDQSGLTVADNTYFGANPVRDAGSDNEQPNRIRRAKRLVHTAGLARATFILANPADVETWDTLTTTDGQYLFGGPLLAGSVGRMWGLPIYEDDYVAAGTAIVGDGSMAAVVDRNDAAVYTSDSHDDFFVKNIFVLLAEVRLTLAVFRPAAFVVVTL